MEHPAAEFLDRHGLSHQRDDSTSPTGYADRRWQSLEPEILAKVIDASSARPLRKNGGWICACPAHKSEGARSLSITPRDGGGSIVYCFAECSFVDIADAINDIVGAL